jgi:nickel-dependent lactate racemase
MSKFTVPYGRENLSFDFPPGVEATLVESRSLPPLQDVNKAVREALYNPVGSPPLRNLAEPGMRVCIVVTDITRACPDHVLVPPIIEELIAAGVSDQDITVMIGIGAHRKSTADEKQQKLGPRVVERVRVVDPSPEVRSTLKNLGQTKGGVPIYVNREAVSSDLLIATGLVEPHQYAGFSGGRKTVAIGIAGEETIGFTHGPFFLDHPRTRLGNVEGNLFHEAITEIALKAGLRFILNVVVDDLGRVVALKAGDPTQAFLSLVEVARELYTVPVHRVFDLAVAGVGFPKDANLYQASRAASYLFFAPRPVIKPGGFFIIPARCQEGAGQGPGEQRFFRSMRDASTTKDILDTARHSGIAPGEQRAFIMAKVLEQNQVIIVGSECPDVVRAAKMIPTTTMDEAIALVQKTLGTNLEALVVPHALLTLPVLVED